MGLFLYILRMAAKVLTIILYVVTLAAAYGGYIHPRIWATPAILTLVLPYLAILTLVTAVAWLCCRRFSMAIAGGLVLVLASGPIFSACPIGSAKEGSGRESFSLMTYNVQHCVLGASDSTNHTISAILGSGADIVCIQELGTVRPDEIAGLSDAQADSLRRIYPYRLQDNVWGQSIFSKFPVKFDAEFQNTPQRPDAVAIYAVNIGRRKLTLVNVHLDSYHLSEKERGVVTDIKGVSTAKSSLREFKGSIMSKMKEAFRNRAEQARQISELTARMNGPVIVCGDFNDVPASWAYRQIRGDSFNDAYTETNLGPTVTYNDHRMYFHIDQILYKGNLKALDVNRLKTRWSDHYPLLATFEFTPAE